MLKVEEVARAADLARFRDEWRDLVAQSGGPVFFQTYEWLTAWIDHFWKDRRLAFLFVRRDGRLVALAPLLGDDDGRFSCPGSVVLAANDYTLRAGFLGAEGEVGILDTVVRHLRTTRGGVRLNFMNVLAGSPLLEELPALARRNGFSTFVREGTTSPVVEFQGDWEAYLRSRSKHMRSELRRKTRKIEASGNVTSFTASTPAQCERAIEDVVSIEAMSWKHAAGGSLDLQPDKQRFYRELAKSCAANGWLRLHLLHLDSRPVAYLYGFAFRNEYYAFHTAFDEAYDHLSPGVVLFSRVLQDACREGLRVFLGSMGAGFRDRTLLQAEARWKSELATEVRLRSSVCLFSRGQIRCQARKILQGRVKPFVRASLPFVADVKRRLRRASKPS